MNTVQDDGEEKKEFLRIKAQDKNIGTKQCARGRHCRHLKTLHSIHMEELTLSSHVPSWRERASGGGG